MDNKGCNSNDLQRQFSSELDAVRTRLQVLEEDLQLSHARIQTLEEHLQAVGTITEILDEGLGLNALFKKLLPRISRLIRAERSTLFLFNPETSTICSKAMEGQNDCQLSLKIGEGIVGWVAKHRKAVNIADAYQDTRFNPAVDAMTGFITRSVAAVPLFTREEKLVGILEVLNHEGGPFSDSDLELLQVIGTQTAYSIENAHLEQTILDRNVELEAAKHRAEARQAELDLLYGLEQEATATDNLEQLLDSIVEQTCQRLHSEAGSVLLTDPRSNRLYFHGAAGKSKNVIKGYSLDPGEGVVGWVAHTGKAAIVSDPKDDPRHASELAETIQHPVTALIAVPLIWDGVTIGAIEVLNPTPPPEGTGRYGQEDLQVLTLIAGQVARAVALTREREVRQLNMRLAFLGRMLASVAHDLRNPMTVVSGYAQIMPHEHNAERRQDYADRMLKEIDVMTSMVSDLLAYVKGDTQLTLSPIDLQTLRKEMEDMLNAYCEPRGIHLHMEAQGSTVNLDLGRIKRILFNLGKNAIDALSVGGKISIRLTETAGTLSIQVSDNGPGIPPEILARLYEPFVTSKKTGTGLGLSIVQRFVEDHHGTIEVRSDSTHGTTFEITLPPVSKNPGQD